MIVSRAGPVLWAARSQRGAAIAKPRSGGCCFGWDGHLQNHVLDAVSGDPVVAYACDAFGLGDSWG